MLEDILPRGVGNVLDMLFLMSAENKKKPPKNPIKLELFPTVFLGRGGGTECAPIKVLLLLPLNGHHQQVDYFAM